MKESHETLSAVDFFINLQRPKVPRQATRPVLNSEEETSFELRGATDLTGLELTESYAMYPAVSLSGWYSEVGKIDEDQLPG